MSNINPFHIAIPVHNLEDCRVFYRDILNCEEGRSSDHWVDFNFFGHQLVIHYKAQTQEEEVTNAVDGKHVPVPHYGVVLPWDIFNAFAENLKQKNVQFIIEPYIRFEGQVTKQETFFVEDPNLNVLEIKSLQGTYYKEKS